MADAQLDNPNNVTALERFLQQYRDVRETLQPHRTFQDPAEYKHGYEAVTTTPPRHEPSHEPDEFKRLFLRLKLDFERLSREARRLERSEAHSFNIFEILGLARLEVRTHSRMLADLLDPRGKHGQGTLFLRSFLSHCASADESFPKVLDDVDERHWQVLTELHTTQGRLDIVIRSPDMSFLCVIENKIDATEQADQLTRYQRWMHSQAEDYQTQVLIFLTPTGYASSTAQDGERYLRLSYHDDVSCIVEDVLASVEAPKVRETLIQYVDLVRSL